MKKFIKVYSSSKNSLWKTADGSFDLHSEIRSFKNSSTGYKGKLTTFVLYRRDAAGKAVEILKPKSFDEAKQIINK